MPWERVVLNVLAAAGALWTAAACVLALVTLERALPGRGRWKLTLGLIFAGLVTIFAAIAWADVVSHYAKQVIFGYSYNPFVFAIQEFEGGAGPTTGDPAGRAAWEKMKCGPPPRYPDGSLVLPWWGDPEAGTWCRRLRSTPK